MSIDYGWFVVVDVALLFRISYVYLSFQRIPVCFKRFYADRNFIFTRASMTRYNVPM